MKPDLAAAARYLGGGAPGEEEKRLIAACGKKLLSCVTPLSVWRRFPVAFSEAGVTIAGRSFPGALLRETLAGCGEAALFVVSLGLAPERAAAGCDTLTAAALDAVASTLVESLAADAEALIAARAAEEGCVLTPRVAPGYGDIPLCLQRELVLLTEAEKYAGVRVNECFALLPQKSLTGIVGLKRGKSACRAKDKCASCGMRDCRYRRRPV